MPGGRYSLDFAIKVAIDKYLDHIPLARQERILRRCGLVVTTQTLWDQLQALGRRLESERFKSADRRYVDLLGAWLAPRAKRDVLAIKLGEIEGVQAVGRDEQAEDTSRIAHGQNDGGLQMFPHPGCVAQQPLWHWLEAVHVFAHTPPFVGSVQKHVTSTPAPQQSK